MNFDHFRQASLGDGRKKILEDRLVAEMVELITLKGVKAGETGGRVSGSLAWRRVRGEEGAGPAGEGGASLGGVITPSDWEKRDRVIHIKYSCVKDVYMRGSEEGEKQVGPGFLCWRCGNNKGCKITAL